MGLGGKAQPPVPLKGRLRKKNFYAWIYNEVEVVDIQFEFVIQHHPSPNGEGSEGEVNHLKTKPDENRTSGFKARS